MSAAKLLLIQGCYTALTGAWPLVHMDSFLYVTGPKTDLWLVKTLGLLFVVIGLSFLYSLKRSNHVSHGILALSLCSAVALSAVDILYSLTDVISDVYLLDALAQIFFIVCWIYFLTAYHIGKRRDLVNFAS